MLELHSLEKVWNESADYSVPLNAKRKDPFLLLSCSI